MSYNSWRISLDINLYDAAKNGDMALLEQVLFPRPRQVDEEAEARCLLLGVTHGGDTALHIAARFGHLEVATTICSINVSLLMKDNNKLETPLHYAARAGKCDLVAHFIHLTNHIVQLGGISRKRNRDGETALYQAVLYKHSDVVEKFRNANESHVFSQLVSIPNNENISPLYLAIMHGQHDIFTSLIGSLREVEDVPPEAYAGPDGLTALHAAAVHKIIPKGFVQEVLDWKLELAKSTDKSGNTALHYAASCGNLEAVRVILEKNITCAYMADSSGLYPVHIAVKMGFVEIVDKLFDRCPDIDQLLDNNGRNFVHLAVEEQIDSIVRWICKKTELTEAMNAQDSNGDTAMHLAVKAGHLNIFGRLLGTGKAHLCMTNKDGLTPHDIAMSNRTAGFSNWQNPDWMMIRILQVITCCRGIKRRDHFVSEFRLQHAQKREKFVEGIDSMAKTNAIGAVLIASAAFAGTFSVSAAYKADNLSGHKSASLDFAFKSFILMVVLAFGCSIVATSIVMKSALTFLAPIYREKYIGLCSGLIRLATMSFVASFAIGVYIVLSPVSMWFAYLVSISLAVVPVLFHPHHWPNCLLTRALIKYLGWKGLLFGCYSLIFFMHHILFAIFVILVLLGSLESHLRVGVLVYGTALLFFAFLLYFIRVRYIIKTI